MLITRTILFLLILSIPFVEAFAQRDKKKPSAPAVSDELRRAQAESDFVEGEKYFILEDYSKALAFFQRAAQLNPGDAGAHYKVAEVLSKSAGDQDLALALVSIETGLRIEKKNKFFYQLAADIHAGKQEFNKAAAVLETMMKEVAGQEESLYDIAAFHSYANKYDEAIKAYNRAESHFGVNEIASLQKQRLYLEQGKVNEAINETERLIKAFPDEPQYVMAFAETLNQNNQKQRAIQCLEKFQEENPNNGNVKMLLSVFYKEAGELQKANQLLLMVFDDPALETTGKVLAIGTLNAEIALARERKTPDNELEQFALTLFDKLKTTDPDNETVSLVGGDLHLSLKKNAEAKFYYRKAIKQGTSGFEPWQNLLALENQDNDYDSLIAHSEEGLELFPNQAGLYYFNGYGHLRKKHYKEAVYSLEQAKKLTPANDKLLGDIHAMLGDTYNAMKQYAQSDAAYDEALALNPNHDFVLNNYSYFLSLRKDKLDKAEAMAAKLTRLVPDNAAYLDTHGWVLYTAGKYREARKVMEKAIALPQASATHFEHFGDILFQLGDIDGAVRQWEKARAMGNNTDTLSKKIANRKLN